MCEKACDRCGIVKPYSEFSKNSQRKDGLHKYCKKCNSDYKKQLQKNYIEKNKESRPDILVKKCGLCQEVKDVSEFSINNLRHDGYASRCRSCSSIKGKEKYTSNKSNYAGPDIEFLKCRECGKVKPIDQFNKNHCKSNGLEKLCKECYNNYALKMREKYKESNRVKGITIEYKCCSSCGETKPINQFTKNRCGYDGLDHRCKECSSKFIREYCKTPEGKMMIARKSHRRRYKEMIVGPSTLTIDQWELCISETDNKCPMCERSFDEEIKATIDHIYPLNLGGSLTYWNVQPLCKQCNSSKCDSVRPDHEIRKAQTIANRLAFILNIST